MSGKGRTPVPEARLVEADGGLKPDSDDGWFVVNLADARTMGFDERQYEISLEAERGGFPHFGINVTVLGPGKPMAMYHAEAGQEAFLVLHGECVLIAEEQERRLRQWDFVHCPPETAHVIVGAGDGPCAIMAVGARNAGPELVYPASEAAARHRAAVAEDTEDEEQAYAGWPPLVPVHCPWPPRP